MGCPHLALNLRFGCQSRNRVYDQYFHCAGTHQHLRHFQCLLAGIGLGHDQVVHLHSQFFGVGRVECVLRVNKSSGATQFLTLGDHLQSQSGFAG